MLFEFDPGKSAANQAKHGIDFVAAQGLWEGKVVELPSANPGELRRLVLGKIGERHWTAAVTQRANRLRIISVRRSRDSEKATYEKYC